MKVDICPLIAQRCKTIIIIIINTIYVSYLTKIGISGTPEVHPKQAMRPETHFLKNLSAAQHLFCEAFVASNQPARMHFTKLPHHTLVALSRHGLELS